MNSSKYWLLFLVLVALTVLSSAAPSHAQFPSDGLLAYWPFDGHAQDASGNGFDLALVGAPAPEFADGVSQNTKESLELINDTADPLQYAVRAEADLTPIDDPEFDFGDRDYTMSIWVNFNPAGLVNANIRDEQTIMEKFDDGGGPGWTLGALTGPPRLTQGGTFHWFVHDNGPNNMKPDPARNEFDADRWYHLAMQRDGGMFRGYLDGALLVENPAGDQTDAANPLYIGRRNPGDVRGFAFYGRIDEVGIWNRALSADEIGDLYNGGDGVSGSNGGGEITEVEWRNDASGDWNVNTSWSPSKIPESNRFTATFGDAITSQHTVFTDADVTVKNIQFVNTATYAVSGPGSITVEAGTNDPPTSSIDVFLGDHLFQTAVNLNNDVDVTIDNGSLEFWGPLNLQANTLNKLGAGDLAIRNDLATGGGTVNITAGRLSGGGTVGGDLNNEGGTLAPGNSPGVLDAHGQVPEPSAWALLTLGVSLLLATRRGGSSCS